ncbi:MAG: hypothetical protein CL916_01995 [Deltaproteobacteria bacterium]|nr:hypothetical protein [Deltaproteobacteria bacterium]
MDWLRCALPRTIKDTTRLRHPFVIKHITQALSIALEHPSYATLNLSNYFRTQRSLGSKDRRRVQDAVYGLIRHQGLITRAGYWNSHDWAEIWASICEGERFEDISAQSPKQDFACALSLPNHISDIFFNTFSEQDCLQLALLINTPPPIYLRTKQGSRLKIQNKLHKQQIITTPTEGMRNTLQVEGRANILGSRSFQDGLIEIQDLSSQQLCERISSLGERFLDLCAGAGGKSLALANEGKTVFANEPRSHAQRELQKRAKRARLKISTQLPQADSMDVVLIDAPCSGSGRLHRDPALRWRIAFEEHTKVQKELLKYATTFVRSGGYIVYATCSLFDAENKHIIPKGYSIEERYILPNNQDGFYWHIWRYGESS